MVFLSIEAIGMTVLAVTVLVELLVARATSTPSAIALTVLTFSAVAFIIAILVGVLRRQAWTRAASVVWQILQAAVGIGAVQGSFASPGWGIPLIVLAVLTLLVGMSKSVGAELATRDSR
ncbi:hypothetical protein BH11ACT3_BH11ACT3_22300 [soil metagenome]